MGFVRGFAGFCGVLLVNASVIIATLSFLGYVEFKEVVFGCIFLLITGLVEVGASEAERGENEDSKVEHKEGGKDAK